MFNFHNKSTAQIPVSTVSHLFLQIGNLPPGVVRQLGLFRQAENNPFAKGRRCVFFH